MEDSSNELPFTEIPSGSESPDYSPEKNPYQELEETGRQFFEPNIKVIVEEEDWGKKEKRGLIFNTYQLFQNITTNFQTELLKTITKWKTENSAEIENSEAIENFISKDSDCLPRLTIYGSEEEADIKLQTYLGIEEQIFSGGILVILNLPEISNPHEPSKYPLSENDQQTIRHAIIELARSSFAIKKLDSEREGALRFHRMSEQGMHHTQADGYSPNEEYYYVGCFYR